MSLGSLLGTWKSQKSEEGNQTYHCNKSLFVCIQFVTNQDSDILELLVTKNFCFQYKCKLSAMGVFINAAFGNSEWPGVPV